MVCAIVGDSIALGTSYYFPQCYHSAKVGIPSKAVIGRVPLNLTKWIVISAGSNDAYNHSLERNLEAIRARTHSSQVIWIVPQNRRAANVVETVAARHHDHTIHFKSGRDHIHPRSYSTVARAIKNVV